MQNMNGAYIFEDVDEKVLDKISDDLSIDKVQLRNTDSNYWSGKIEVKSTAENGSVTVRLLTASEEFNELVEEKVDALVKEAETHLENVTINKVNSFTTSSPTDTENEDEIAVKVLLSIREQLSKVQLLHLYLQYSLYYL